jgi:type VI secretion system protein
MQKVVPDLDVFVDVFSLRSGDRWEQKLKDYVPTRDTFYLFWSKRASESVWVEREWRLALESRGLDYIDPVPLEEPGLAPPPPELAALHFADAYVSYIRYFHMSRGLIDALEPWSEFVKGAGIPGTNVPDGRTINEALAKAGALLRCLSEVVVDSVLGVSHLRHELSLPRPKPHPAGNNPFYFCIDADNLLKRLLAPSSSEWMDGRDAISAVSRDLRAHNLALVAGCQSATKALMEALDPRGVRERTEEAKWLSAGLPLLKDARCWKAYQDRYEELQGALFEKEGLLRKRFASAYQDKCHEVVKQKLAPD